MFIPLLGLLTPSTCSQRVRISYGQNYHSEHQIDLFEDIRFDAIRDSWTETNSEIRFQDENTHLDITIQKDAPQESGP